MIKVKQKISVFLNKNFFGGDSCAVKGFFDEKTVIKFNNDGFSVFLVIILIIFYTPILYVLIGKSCQDVVLNARIFITKRSNNLAK